MSDGEGGAEKKSAQPFRQKVRGWPRKLLHCLGRPVFPPKPESEEKDSEGGDDRRLAISMGRRAIKVEMSEPAAGAGSGADGAAKKAGGGGLGAAVLKAAGAVAVAIGVTGALVVTGATVLWIRFNQVGLPATQAVSVQPKYEPLVQGAQSVILFVLIALAAVLLVFLADREGRITRLTLAVLGALTAGAILYVILTSLSLLWTLVLSGVAVLLAVGCVVVGRRTDAAFWPLALAVFAASLVFSAACGVLIVYQENFVQGVAVLRGAEDEGLTGVYVTATDNTLYVGRRTPIATSDGTTSRKMAMFDVARASSVTYAVGPLESEDDATRRARAMLAQLIVSREQVATAPAPAAKGDGGAGKEGGGEAKGEQGPPKPTPLADNAVDEDVLRTFTGPISLRRTVGPKGLCLVRYAEVGKNPESGHWWTSCGEARSFKTILSAKDRLALPGRFQTVYDTRLEVKLPLGAELTYLRGKVAEQCEHDEPLPCGYRYHGGGVQFYVLDPNGPVAVSRQVPTIKCTTARPDRPSRWEDCKS